jgi:hypothetical protein
VDPLRELSVDELVRLVWMLHDENERLRGALREQRVDERDRVTPVAPVRCE